MIGDLAAKLNPGDRSVGWGEHVQVVEAKLGDAETARRDGYAYQKSKIFRLKASKISGKSAISRHSSSRKSRKSLNEIMTQPRNTTPESSVSERRWADTNGQRPLSKWFSSWQTASGHQEASGSDLFLVKGMPTKHYWIRIDYHCNCRCKLSNQEGFPQ
jgi:hypothetical protein